MVNAINISTQLPPAEAKALLLAMREQYRSSLNEYWYADEYRYVPKETRHSSILENKPVMAAQKRLMAALTFSLETVKKK